MSQRLSFSCGAARRFHPALIPHALLPGGREEPDRRTRGAAVPPLSCRTLSLVVSAAHDRARRSGRDRVRDRAVPVVQVVLWGVSPRRVARSRWRTKKPPASSARPNITAAPIPKAPHAKPRVEFVGCDVTAAAFCLPSPCYSWLSASLRSISARLSASLRSISARSGCGHALGPLAGRARTSG